MHSNFIVEDCLENYCVLLVLSLLNHQHMLLKNWVHGKISFNPPPSSPYALPPVMIWEDPNGWHLDKGRTTFWFGDNSGWVEELALPDQLTNGRGCKSKNFIGLIPIAAGPCGPLVINCWALSYSFHPLFLPTYFHWLLAIFCSFSVGLVGQILSRVVLVQCRPTSETANIIAY